MLAVLVHSETLDTYFVESDKNRTYSNGIQFTIGSGQNGILFDTPHTSVEEPHREWEYL